MNRSVISKIRHFEVEAIVFVASDTANYENGWIITVMSALHIEFLVWRSNVSSVGSACVRLIARLQRREENRDIDNSVPVLRQKDSLRHLRI